MEVRRSSASSTSLTNSQRSKYACASAGVIEAIKHDTTRREIGTVRRWSSDAAQILEAPGLFGYTESYSPGKRPGSGVPKGEGSNQLFEILEEWKRQDGTRSEWTIDARCVSI